ncbi:MAG: histidine phosphotransferase family protein [Paracoccaceae bacterium]
MTETPDLAALIGSRICHDLISPIGAIGNGVELLLMEGASKSPEIALIADSVTHANARIRFFRVAFGAASQGQRIGAPEVTGILSDMMRGGRLSVAWDGPADLPRAEVKLAFLALMCLESAMPFGGRISVVAEGWRITAQAAKLRLDPALWGPLARSEAPAEVGPAQVQFALLPDQAGRLGRVLGVKTGDEVVTIGF